MFKLIVIDDAEPSKASVYHAESYDLHPEGVVGDWGGPQLIGALVPGSYEDLAVELNDDESAILAGLGISGHKRNE